MLLLQISKTYPPARSVHIANSAADFVANTRFVTTATTRTVFSVIKSKVDLWTRLTVSQHQKNESAQDGVQDQQDECNRATRRMYAEVEQYFARQAAIASHNSGGDIDIDPIWTRPEPQVNIDSAAGEELHRLVLEERLVWELS